MSAKLKKRTLLIVDDDPAGRMVLCDSILKAFPHFEILQAPDALVAHEVIREFTPDLIVTDWDMPLESGLKLIQDLQQEVSTRDIPIIMCTGVMVSSGYLDISLDTGAQAYISKPIDPVELKAKVRTLLKIADRTQELIAEKTKLGLLRLELEKERAQRKIERLQYEKEQVERAAALKSSFFSKLTHEFQTPINLIVGPLTEILQQSKQHHIRLRAEIALRNSKVMLRLVNQLMTLARAESEVLILRPVRMDLAHFLQDRLRAFRATFRKKGLQLRAVIPFEPLWVDFDPDMMEQIINNLLSNAYKFTPAYGEVEVKLKPTSPESPLVQISVRDTGIGISDLQLDGLFDPFQGSRTWDPPAEMGTGLGLSMVKELVKLHGGKIRASSIEGLGSEFKIEVPLHQEQVKLSATDWVPLLANTEQELAAMEVIQEDQSMEDGRGSKKQVLVIDKHAGIRDYLRLSLGMDYLVIEAKDGATGLVRAMELLPEVIVLELGLPDLNGIEVCAQLKQNAATKHIPILLLSDSAESVDKIRGLLSGADAYLEKPFDINVLKAQLVSLLQNQVRVRQAFRNKSKFLSLVSEASSEDELFIQNLKDRISKNLSNEHFSMDLLAGEMAMSRTQLHRKVKALTGQAPGEYLRDTRLEVAYFLLEKKAFSVAEVAHQVGYLSHSSFTTAFRKRFNLLPKEVWSKEAL